jgi:phosphatidylglycerol---prolipoprotein diacylglyceryl transferase
MTFYNFIIWNGNPEIVDLGIFPLRWYGILFALGFLLSQQILYYIFKKEGKPKDDVDLLTIYMVVATIVGARLGHILFYQPEIIIQDPLSVFLPFQFKPEFKFTGFQGLASHGGAIGILLALYLYARKKKPGQNYLQTLDRIVIVVALTGALIRFGNFFNSEIIGKPTHNRYGVVFARYITDIIKTDEYVKSVTYEKTDSARNSKGYPQLIINVHFKEGKLTGNEHEKASYLQYEIADELSKNEYVQEHIDQSDKVTSSIRNGIGIITVYAIPRYPAQLLESISCTILFIVLFLIWNKHRQNLKPGFLFGLFLVVCFGLRFIYEYLKVNQEDFENNLPINMGQILSIPLILVGIFLLVRSVKKTESERLTNNL